MTPTLRDRVTLVKSSKSFRNNSVRLIEKVTNPSYARNNLNDPNNAIILRLHDLEKTYAHISKKCYYQTWAVGRLRDPSIQFRLIWKLLITSWCKDKLTLVKPHDSTSLGSLSPNLDSAKHSTIDLSETNWKAIDAINMGRLG